MTIEELLAVSKPILFNTDMTRAILEDRKTVTRRIAKGFVSLDDKGTIFNVFRKGEWTGPIARDLFIKTYAPCQVGDYLYVRETWSEWTGGYLYRAWAEPFAQPGESAIMQWHPSIHMPKEAARIFLRVTDVRVERLQDIGNCVKEGIATGTHATAYMNYYDERCDFAALWNSIIPQKDMDKYGWNANPWVWVIEFERVIPDEVRETAADG